MKCSTFKAFSASPSAECYSGDDAWETYKIGGPSRQCFTCNYDPCDFECEGEPCTGSYYTVFVYKIGACGFEQKLYDSCLLARYDLKKALTLADGLVLLLVGVAVVGWVGSVAFVAGTAEDVFGGLEHEVDVLLPENRKKP